ncbi:hypothetical protein PATSB16_18970 [Pandoraea thiooxydans]|uniref:Uncharacterized protein n=1 Tax=Pandoraea thiooxydans TaxID=445709 RepID=A0A0G3ELT1_9BURK|nr:hypothetical protein [Pandoraea thiooxydans]AKJ68008.1 hypothetical protein ABW99_07055 [Pandoraea thiooxydans]APR95237.1 hypothetical protein PATSB16_18970 [Pandoraea thiooxydans]
MTPERFQTLVETYGADERHWPRDERVDAQRWAARHRAAADEMLAAAASLDDLLAAHRVAPPDSALMRRIVAGAPKRMLIERAQIWWSSAIFAGAGVAGALAGALIVSFFLVSNEPAAGHYGGEPLTSFSGSVQQWGG